MRIFVTGATGFVGSAVVQDLIRAGHQVLGLARSEASAQSLLKAGAEVHRGSLEDIDSLKKGAAQSDGVIHTAFIHDFSNFGPSCETDGQAIEAMGSVLAGSNRPLIITSGTAIVRSNDIITENNVVTMSNAATPRGATEEAAATVAKWGVHTSIVRLPPSVHDKGDHGFIPIVINVARDKGVSAYIGNGQNRWPAVHRQDAAQVFRLALEKAAPYATYHAIGDEGIPVHDIAEAIGRHLKVPVISKKAEEAAEHFGWLGAFLTFDMPATATRTQQELQWQPSHPGLIADLNLGHYFLS
jgi:nucleoside-diphosphate-sugar epimerase